MKTPLLDGPQLAAELAARPGLIPVSIEFPSAESPPRLLWCDLNRYHCYEGFFHLSMKSYLALSSVPPARFLTPLETPGSISWADLSPGLCREDTLPPSGFIFHAGRCGSTLLAKVLARSRENMVFSEARPHHLAWKVLPPGRDCAVRFFRSLVLAMGRRRLESYRAHYIKFTSYSVLQFQLIREAFPDTPALFLFRDPDKVLASSAREVQPWLGTDIGLGQVWTDAGDAMRDFCRAALGIRDSRFRFLDHSEITPRNLERILRFFGDGKSPREMKLMESEFLWDAKSGRIPRPFIPRATPPVCADASLRSLYREMTRRSVADWT